MSKKNSHIAYYSSLLVVLAIGIALIVFFYPNKNLQMVCVVGMSIGYLAIGLIHHLKNHDLVAKIMIEYILIAVFGIVAAFFIFKGGFGI